MKEADTREVTQRLQERPTIGLLAAWIGAGYENEFMLKMSAVAEVLDVNLICVVGGKVGWEENFVFELVGPQRFDGLIVSGSVGHGIDLEALQRFCARFAPLPLVGVGLSLPDIVQVLPDSASGMREAVEHLVRVHNLRRIAFIKGPEGQVEAQERYQAYVDVLAAHDIPLDPELITFGDYRRGSGQAAMRELLSREVSFEAVVAANDLMALGAFDVLRAHGRRVPEDVALVGFDDVAEARNFEIPLTTVRQSISELTHAALTTLLDRIRGDQDDAQLADGAVRIPTRLVIRRSCGCQPDAGAESGAASVVTELSWDGEGPDTPPVPPNVPEPLWRAFLADLADAEATRFIPEWLADLRRLQAEASTDAPSAELWVDTAGPLLTALRQAALPHLADARQLIEAGELLQQARALSRTQALGKSRNLLFGQQELQEFERALAAALAWPDLREPIEQHFPALGVDHAYVVLDALDAASRDEVQLVLAYGHGGKVTLQKDGPTFPARQLLPQEMAWEQRRYTALLMPLLVRERQLGFLLLELGVREGAFYHRLAEQLSGGIFRMRLLEEQARARTALEEARERAETALRDLMALQQRYVRDAWQTHARVASGYARAPEGEGPTERAWLPIMGAAVTEDGPVQQPLASDGSSLGLPLRLYGETIGVLGLERVEGGGWSAEEVALAQGLLEHTARALETQRLVDETQRRAAQLQTATQVAQITSSILTLEALLDQAVNLVREHFGYYYVGLFLVEETGSWAVLRAGTGDAGRVMLERGHRLAVGGNSMIGRCVAQNQAQIALDVGEERVRFDNPLLPDTHSEIALPLRSRGRAIGAITIQATEQAAFSEEDLNILQTMADQLGNAIENVRLLDEREQTVRALEAAQGTYTQESWRAYLETMGRAQGYRYRLGLEPLSELYPEAQVALAEHQPIVTVSAPSTADGAEETPAQGALAVPVRLREQIIGALNVRFEDEHVPPEMISLVEQVAEQLALSLENARLYEDTRQRAAQERLVGEVMAQVRETLDLERMVRTAVEELRGRLGLERLVVRLGVPEKEEGLE